MAVRYHDGTRWTEFVCLAARSIVGRIQRIPLPAEIAATSGQESIGEEDTGHGHAPSVGASTPAHITSLIYYIALAFIGGCLVAISKAVPRDSTAFEWTNRIGVLLLLTLTVSYAINDVWASLSGRRSGESWVDRWIPVLISIIIPAVLLLKGWDRVLDALWLR